MVGVLYRVRAHPTPRCKLPGIWHWKSQFANASHVLHTAVLWAELSAVHMCEETWERQLVCSNTAWKGKH